MFAMLFTVGAGYFLFVNQSNLLYTQALVNKTKLLQDRLNENFMLTPSVGGGHVKFVATDNGGQPATITGAFVIDSSGGVSFANLNVPVNPGSSSASIDTGITAPAGTWTLKTITQRGSSFSATYPPSVSALATQSITGGAIGDLYLQFDTYKYFKVVSCGSNSCLSLVNRAFRVPLSDASSNIAFSVTVTNLDSDQKSITLDQYSLLAQFDLPKPGGGGGTARQYAWYIISNSSNTIQNTYSQIVLPYSQPVTLVFGSSTSGTFTAYEPDIKSTTVMLVFILLHGCEGSPPASCTPSTFNYGQNLPYASTLYN